MEILSFSDFPTTGEKRQFLSVVTEERLFPLSCFLFFAGISKGDDYTPFFLFSLNERVE